MSAVRPWLRHCCRCRRLLSPFISSPLPATRTRASGAKEAEALLIAFQALPRPFDVTRYALQHASSARLLHLSLSTHTTALLRQWRLLSESDRQAGAEAILSFASDRACRAAAIRVVPVCTRCWPAAEAELAGWRRQCGVGPSALRAAHRCPHRSSITVGPAVGCGCRAVSGERDVAGRPAHSSSWE